MRRSCGSRYPSFVCAFAPLALKPVIALSSPCASCCVVWAPIVAAYRAWYRRA